MYHYGAETRWDRRGARALSMKRTGVMNKLLFFLTALFGVNCHHVLMGQEVVAAESSVYDVAERQMHEDSLARSETTLQNH